MKLSIVMPVLDEADTLSDMLAALAPLRARGHQLIVVDGGSRDDSLALAAASSDDAITAPRGRASQMNAGAARARGEVLLFLHADTHLPDNADAAVLHAVVEGAAWGRFDVSIDGRSPMLRWVGGFMNARSRLTGIATGDQAIFVRRDLFQRLGGYADQPLMEDIELSGRLRAIARPACLHQRVRTSGRRWESRGVWRTIALMWRLRWRYWRGVSPEVLAREYR